MVGVEFFKRGHSDAPSPNVEPAQLPQKVVSMMRVWLKNFSAKESEHGPEKLALGVPKDSGSGMTVSTFKLVGILSRGKNLGV